MPDSEPQKADLEHQAPVDTRILVVEDEPLAREAVKTYLENEGFGVDTAQDGDEMRTHLETAIPAIVLMDVRLPGEDGFELTRYLRKNYNVGIIILTTKSELVDRVVGLEIGADDYLTKPYENRELLARIRSLLRRLDQVQSKTVNGSGDQSQSVPNYRFENCILNGQRRCLIGPDGEALDLTSSELRLLMAFVENPFSTLSRSDLMRTVCQRDWNPLDRSIDVLVTKIRRKLDGMTENPALIRSVRGVGYELAVDVVVE